MVSPKNSVTRKNVPRYYTLNGQVRYIYLTNKYGGLLKSKSKFKPALRNDLPIKKNTVFISVFGLGSMENVFLPVELHTRSGLHAAVD